MEKFENPQQGAATLPRSASQPAPAQWLRSFAYYSANMHHLLPDLPLHTAYQSFRQTRLRRQRNRDPHRHLAAMQRLKEAHHIGRNLREPGVIASFHYSTYPVLCGYLMACGIPFSLLLSSAMFANQAETYRRLYERVTGKQPTAATFELIDAGKPNSLLAMKRSVENGKHVVCFVDGNAGAAQTTNLLTIPFLSGELRVRGGAAFLSYRMGCPIYPAAITEKDDGELAIAWGATIQPPSGLGVKCYMKEAMRAVYALLEGQILHKVPDWEAWQYIHGDLVVPSDSFIRFAGSDIHFFSRYAPFSTGHGTYIFDKFHYCAYAVPAAIYVKILVPYLELVGV